MRNYVDLSYGRAAKPFLEVMLNLPKKACRAPSALRVLGLNYLLVAKCALPFCRVVTHPTRYCVKRAMLAGDADRSALIMTGAWATKRKILREVLGFATTIPVWPETGCRR